MTLWIVAAGALLVGWSSRRDQATPFIRGDGGEFYPPATGLLVDLRHDRERAVNPMPTINLLPPQGSFSAADSGVCPNSFR